MPVAVLGLAAFVLGVIVGGRSASEEAVQRFTEAWARQDYEAMHGELTENTAARYPINRFTTLYDEAERTATIESVEPHDPDGTETVSGREAVTVPVDVRTHAFGDLGGTLAIPVADGEIAWAPHLVFPGLSDGERLSRRADVPERAPILAKNGAPLAEGPASARSSPISGATINVAGELGVPKGAEEARLEQRGFPDGTLVGKNGLEKAFNTRLAGQPGGELLASSDAGDEGQSRVLASADPVKGKPVRTTIDPVLQEAAVTALGSAFGGVAVLDAKDGTVLGVAGIAFSSPQPPGSTFKVVTTVAALESGVVKLNDTFPVESSTTVEGREIANAGDAACGGTFVQSFTNSCNTVFAPLGPEIGNDKLVATAERFGWNSEPTLFNAQATGAIMPPESTIPTSIGDDLDLAVSAIGQGEVLATPLSMASVSQTIAADGMRSPNPIVSDPRLGPDAEPVRVTSGKIAATVRDLMVGVVSNGTGTAAALPGIEVAGKTGTAELGPAPASPDQGAGAEPEQQEDAWFTSFAPANNPKIAVAVLVVNVKGGGGAVAAPIAREVLSAGLL
jgi:penicillin-binding protein A